MSNNSDNKPTGSIVVLQCRNCDVILGDSSEYGHHDESEATLTLKTAINVKVDNKKKFEYPSFVSSLIARWALLEPIPFKT